MTETTLLSVLKELRISREDYSSIVQNINRMKLISHEKRQRILEDADKKLPKGILTRADKLLEDLAYGDDVYLTAEIPYHEGPPEGQKLFTTAVADYLLRKRPFEAKEISDSL